MASCRGPPIPELRLESLRLKERIRCGRCSRPDQPVDLRGPSDCNCQSRARTTVELTHFLSDLLESICSQEPDHPALALMRGPAVRTMRFLEVQRWQRSGMEPPESRGCLE